MQVPPAAHCTSLWLHVRRAWRWCTPTHLDDVLAAKHMLLLLLLLGAHHCLAGAAAEAVCHLGHCQRAGAIQQCAIWEEAEVPTRSQGAVHNNTSRKLQCRKSQCICRRALSLCCSRAPPHGGLIQPAVALHTRPTACALTPSTHNRALTDIVKGSMSRDSAWLTCCLTRSCCIFYTQPTSSTHWMIACLCLHTPSQHTSTPEVCDQEARPFPPPLAHALADVCVAAHIQSVKAQVRAFQEQPSPAASVAPAHQLLAGLYVLVASPIRLLASSLPVVRMLQQRVVQSQQAEAKHGSWSGVHSSTSVLFSNQSWACSSFERFRVVCSNCCNARLCVRLCKRPAICWLTSVRCRHCLHTHAARPRVYGSRFEKIIVMSSSVKSRCMGASSS